MQRDNIVTTTTNEQNKYNYKKRAFRLYCNPMPSITVGNTQTRSHYQSLEKSPVVLQAIKDVETNGRLSITHENTLIP